MNSRFRLSTKVWLLTAATGMVFCPTFALLGQTESRQDTSGTRRNDQQTSVVQKELEKLYKQDRRPVPKMTTKDALTALRNTRKAEQQSRVDRTKTANHRLSEKTAWFDKFLPTGVKSRKQEVKKQESVRPASSGVRAVGMTEQANQPKTVSPITHTGQTLSHSISSSKSVTLVNKVASKVAPDSSPIRAVASKAAAGKVAKSQPKSMQPPRLLHSFAKKTAQWIKLSKGKKKAWTKKNPKQTVASKSSSSESQPATLSESADVRTASSKTSTIRPVAKSQVSVNRKTSTVNAKPSSKIVQQLEQLYKRDGRKMPAMNLADQRSSRLKREMQQKAAPSDVRKKGTAKSLFSRVFKLNRSRRTPTNRQQRIVNKPTPQHSQPQSRIPASVTPPAPEKLARPAAKKRSPGSIASAPVKQPRGDAKVVVRPKVAKTPASSKSIDSNLPAAGVAEENPYEGLKLTENQLESARRMPDDPKSDTDAKSKTSAKSKDEQKVAEKPNQVGGEKKTLLVLNSQVAAKPPLEKDVKDITQLDMKQNVDKYKQISQRSSLKGLKGFCPVVLRDRRELVDAKPEFRSHNNLITYEFSSAEALASFNKNPAAYTPVSGGNDVVLLAQTRVGIEGSLNHAAWYKERLYLFTSSETLQVFVANPGEYTLFE